MGRSEGASLSLCGSREGRYEEVRRGREVCKDGEMWSRSDTRVQGRGGIISAVSSEPLFVRSGDGIAER